jgi:uncharacterized protein YpuA (DUF1002 family)
MAFSLVLTAVTLGALGFWQARQTGVSTRKPQMSKDVDPVSASVQKHMYDTHLMEEMARRKSLIENQRSLSKRPGEDYAVVPDGDKNYGVQLDQEKTLERVYEDLNLNPSNYRYDNIEDRINSRLANRRWLNQQEKAERIAFVRNFIRQAYDRGWEVQIDANLVVTGVRPIVQRNQVNIEQVLDRIAKQGQ